MSFWHCVHSFSSCARGEGGSCRLSVKLSETFYGLAVHTDTRKVARAIVEHLTDAACYTAKWLKSSSTHSGEKCLVGGRIAPMAHHHDEEHPHDHHGGHGHTHGAVDPSIATSERGIWAVKWSFVALFVTALVQLGVVLLSGSVAHLSDTIHNFGDAATAVPLWIAFALARLGTSRRFPFGYGRVEDLAGVVVVLIILFSAAVAGYQAIERLINPQPVGFLGALAAASIIGFIGNEAVAVFRIRVGREIGSAALVADGYHARTDGWTSLAVLLGAIGVWLGYPLADPLVGLLIAAAILVIVWQSGKMVFSRLLDGVDPSLVGEIRHAASE